MRWRSTDGSDAFSSKTPICARSEMVFEEVPSDPSVLANPSDMGLFVVGAKPNSEVHRAALRVGFRDPPVRKLRPECGGGQQRPVAAVGGPLLVIGIQSCRARSEPVTGDAALINEPPELVHILPPLIFRGLDFRRFREPLGIPEPRAFDRPG